jgi:lipoprotein-anchoring transpeptidase ErfK/SrfK
MSDYQISDKSSVGTDVSAARRWPWGKWALLTLAVLVMLAALGAAGVAYATYDYAEEYEGRILPGSVVAGVDVGGMSAPQALEAVRRSIAPQLDRPLKVGYRGRSWRTTPRRLGARSDAVVAVRAALAASTDTTFLDKMKMRMLGEGLSFERSVAITYPAKGVRGFIEGVAANLDLEPRDASLDSSSGWVEIVPHRNGRRVDQAAARGALMGALRNGAPRITVPVKTLSPEITSDRYDEVLLVRIGENRLYYYRDGEIVNSWPVATGQPEYMTPTGVYEITEKRYMPTWINPAPTTWGADLPEQIPPGPSNPLGLRALNWSAPAIRFHGTSATYSLGYNASHGCVRMSNEDVIELYDTIDVGTPIVSLVSGPLNPLYVSSPDPTPVAENSADDKGRKKGGN